MRPSRFLISINFRAYATTAVPKKWRKPRAEGNSESHFVDFKRVIVEGGKGGDGIISFSRIWCNPFAGPDGSDGGNGGHVIFRANSTVKSLSQVKNRYKADNGKMGGSKSCTGRSADHTYIDVPVGTMFKLSHSQSDNNEILCDLKKPEQIFVAARGGAGGRGNEHFLSNENRAPLCAEFGGQGELKQYDVEMRVMAHAGLVGFPNAGKSTLLRAISRARPKVACYPFTTMNPMVGTIEYDDYEQLAVADIPGLLPSFQNNYGMGNAFLKHIERCLCLFYVIDLSISEPWLQLADLQQQLDQYRAGLSRRPYAIVANKIDMDVAKQNLKEFEQKTDLKILPVSAKFRLGLDELLAYFRELYDTHKNTWENEE